LQCNARESSVHPSAWLSPSEMGRISTAQMRGAGEQVHAEGVGECDTNNRQ
jgi:hypothetical protein